MAEGSEKVDVIIVGAGPAGCVAAMLLAESGYKIALIDKDHFPREKTCGDAIGNDVINQLKFLPEQVREKLEAADRKLPVNGVRLFSPDSNHIDLCLEDEVDNSTQGFVMKRIIFDGILMESVKSYQTISVYEGYHVKDVRLNKDSAEVITNAGSFTGKIILGADGPQSLVRKFLIYWRKLQSSLSY